MTRKQFITIIDKIISRLEKGEQLYTCNEIDDLCLGGLGIESDMRVAYENLMGEWKGIIPTGFLSNKEYVFSELISYDKLNHERSVRRITALSLFKESMLKSGDYKGFEYEKK